MSHNNIPRIFNDIKDPGDRFRLDNLMNKGVYGTVYSAVDTQAGHNKVAIKIQILTSETQELIMEEYRVLQDLSNHPNVPHFHGIYRNRCGKSNKTDEIWLVMELCDGGTIMDLVRQLTNSGKKLHEEHIRYVLREVIKAVTYLHQHNVVHRDIKGDNILLTNEGEVKLADYGFAKPLKNSSDRLSYRIGSPSWMAPEVAACEIKSNKGYSIQADVWSVGITAIELAEGRAPYQDMHPSRILFQIMRNPPPGLHRASNWSVDFVDFIAECLEKNPENRPAMAEIIQHPFIEEVPGNDFTTMQDLKSLLTNVKSEIRIPRPLEYVVWSNRFKTNKDENSKIMLTEDLAALEVITEETVLSELSQRFIQGHFHTFIGDTLVIINPNQHQDIYGNEFHEKYNFKSRSDNEPHIFSIADKAYQDVLHNDEPQHIIIAGESYSGKTFNVINLVNHFMYLGKGLNDVAIGVSRALNLIHAFCHASTQLNDNSTRCIYQIRLTFGPTGKASGAVFSLYQLEKWCISLSDDHRSNFGILYYFYDAMEARGKLQDFKLPPERKLRYLRDGISGYSNRCASDKRNYHLENINIFEKIDEIMILMEFDDAAQSIWKTLSAILLIGEISFIINTDNEADVDDMKLSSFVAELLGLDQKKFVWSLTNYCLIKKGEAIRHKYICEEALLARDILACTLYQRLVDWIINFINLKLSVTRTLFGSKYLVSILDFFGFECFTYNRVEQLIVNTVNEQLQCYYNQRVFIWEMQDNEEEHIPTTSFNFYDNEEVVEQLMNKKYGIFQIIDQASRQSEDVQFIIKKFECYKRNSHVKILSSHEFSVAHYTGKVNYDITDIVERNRDFVSPEMINTMRLSTLHLIKQMFFGKLSRTGNLISESNLVDKPKENEIHKNLLPLKLNKNRIIPKDQYSQTKKMRSCTSTFRNVCLEILNNLSVSQKNIGIHFIRCIRADLKKEPWGFNQYIVKQQVKALGVIETACTRQEGYAYRIPFQEFLRRYQFLAFDFGEQVDISKENCRLLLIRLKMEGWRISRSKVFLKYYNEEYLSRLYETQVRKIIKIQSMLRAFLACKKLNKAAQKKKINGKKKVLDQKKGTDLSEDDAALLIQKTYRGHALRKELHTQRSTMEYNTIILIQFYCIKWKLKSVYQILLQYRAIRFHQLVQMSQQVHLFNRSLAHRISTENPQIDMNKIELNVGKDRYLGQKPRSVYKLPFNFYRDFLNFDAAHLTEQSEKLRKNGSDSSASDEDNETWDSTLKREIFNWPSTKKIKKNIGVQTTNSPHRTQHTIMKPNHSIINSPFIRDPRTSSNPLQEKDLHNNRFTKCVLGNQRPMITHEEWNVNAAASEKSQNSILGNETNNNFVDITRYHAVQELQSIGKKKDHTELDEEQPYNFQALLRKTPYQRPSMKRNQIYESNVQSFSRPRNQPNKSHITTNKTTIIKTNEMKNINSYPTENFNVLTENNLTNKTFFIDNFITNNHEKCDLTIEKNINDRQQYKSIDTDDVSSFKLAPGVIVEGYSADF